MKKTILITALIITSAVGFAGLANSYLAARFMTISDGEKKWEALTLNAEQFKKGDLFKRAPMAVDIVKRSLYVDKSRKTVRDDPGDPDSNFFCDSIYAYKIMPFSGENKFEV